MCTRAVCALARYIEAAGIATVVIGLVPQHVFKMQPPRALCVPFELGRPMGPPGERALQRDVLLSALTLAEREEKDRPVCVTYESDYQVSGQEVQWVCPVSFAPPEDDSWSARLAAEVQSLSPWYAQSVRDRGRTTVGVSQLGFLDCADWLGSICDDGERVPTKLAHDYANAIKLAVEDLKAFYVEAATAQPSTSSAPVLDWLWNDTVLGQALVLARERLADHEDKQVSLFAKLTFVPHDRLA